MGLEIGGDRCPAQAMSSECIASSCPVEKEEAKRARPNARGRREVAYRRYNGGCRDVGNQSDCLEARSLEQFGYLRHV